MENELKSINKISNMLVVNPLNEKFEEWGFPIRILSLVATSKEVIRGLDLYHFSLDILNPIREEGEEDFNIYKIPPKNPSVFSRWDERWLNYFNIFC